MISYCYLNIVYVENNRWMVIGLIMSISTLVVYGVIGYYLLRGGMYGCTMVSNDNSMNRAAGKVDKGSIVL